MIGGRIQIFHQSSIASEQAIPSINSFPGIASKVEELPQIHRLRYGAYDFWEQAGISLNDIRERIRLGWKSKFEVHHGEEVVPLNVLEPSDRPQIEGAFTWVRRTAKRRGEHEGY
jgi:hypothetical protein